MASANIEQDKLIIFKGDDTGGTFGRPLLFKIEVGEGVSLDGCRAEWEFDGIIKRFDAPLIPGEVLEVFYSHNETRCMELGVRYGTFRIIDAAGKVRTFTNTKPVEVTNNAARCYPGSSAASVVVSGIGDMKHSEFADLEEKKGMTLNEVGSMVNTLIRKLKGTVSAFAALLAFGAFADSSITPQTDFGDISPTSKIGAVLSGGGAVMTETDPTIGLTNGTIHIKGEKITPLTSFTETDPTVPLWAKQPNPPEGMTDNALVLTNDKVQTKGGDENLGEASLGTLHVSRIYNNDLRQGGPLYIVSPWMYAFVDKFIIGKTDQDPNGAYNVTIDEAGISAFNGESYFGFAQGRFGMIALENWQSLSAMLDNAEPSNLAANQAFSDAVLAVGLNIDTNSVAVLNEIADTFGGFPITGTATTVGGLLAALAAAVAWLKKNKVGSFDSVGGATATVDNGVAKLDNFFTESNSLLTGTIDTRLPYPLYAVPSTGLLKDRAINTTSIVFVTVPDNFTDLLIRASVSSSLSVTMPEAIATKYGDTFPGEAGEYLITITKTGAAEAYVRTIKLEEVA